MRLVKLDGNSIARKWQLAMRTALTGVRRVWARRARKGLYFTRSNSGWQVEGTLRPLPRNGDRVLRPVRITDNWRRSHDR